MSVQHEAHVAAVVHCLLKTERWELSDLLCSEMHESSTIAVFSAMS